MRIGIDATCWPNRRGYGRFARSLLTAALAYDRSNEYVFYVDHESQECPLPEGIEVVRISTGVPTIKAAAADGSRSLLDMWAVSRAIHAHGQDLIFFPSVYSFVPLLDSTPALVTIHDVIPELFPELVFPSWRSKFFWDTKVKLACLQANWILTISDYSRRRLAEQLGISHSRMRIVPEAGDPSFRPLERADDKSFRTRHEIPGGVPLLVYVGGFSPHKNLAGLVDVFSRLHAQALFADVRLLLVGDYESDVFYSCFPQLRTQVQQLGLQDHVLFTGYMADEDLVLLYNLAAAVVLPSFCEGFGLPAVEAAACGTPSVVTTESPLVELLGAGTIGVAPDDSEGWLKALTAVLGDERRRETMGSAALAAAARLSWKESARHLLSIFDEVLEPRAAAH